MPLQKWILFHLLLFFWIILCCVEEGSGQQCTSQAARDCYRRRSRYQYRRRQEVVTRYRSESYATYRGCGWLWRNRCRSGTGYRRVSYTTVIYHTEGYLTYYSERYCCYGYRWTGASCEPICSCASGQTCIAPYTCRRGVELRLNGLIYANNSVVGLTRVVQECSTLVCTTDLSSHTYLQGSWYYPNKTAIRSGSSGNGFFITRGVYNEIYLHRSNHINHPSGTYCCVHYTANHQRQTVCISLDTNECSGGTHSCNQYCRNTIDSYICECNSGYILGTDGWSCHDINECASNQTHECEQHCINTIGSYECSCNQSFYLGNDGQSCFGCARGTPNCYQYCSDTIECCSIGYVGGDGDSCIDVNECDGIHGCDHQCKNTNGSYQCTCNVGFQLGNDNHSCHDTDECELSTHVCQHLCNNTYGSYECRCKSGYILSNDSYSCLDVNECDTGMHSCDQQCNNTAGSYKCSCDFGFGLGYDRQTCLLKSDVIITGTTDLEELNTLSLFCTAIPPATISWVKRSSEGVKIIVPSSRISLHTQQVTGSSGLLTTRSSLIIEEVIVTDGSEYVCEAENGPDSIPTAENIQVNINVRNECRIDTYGNSPCQNGGMCTDFIRDYRCICVDNYQGVNCEEEGTACARVPVSHVSEPQIVQPPLNTSTSLLTPVNLTCTAWGQPAPNYEWYKDGILIPGETRSFLYISEPQPRDRGSYFCRAINNQGSIKSQEAQLLIPGILQYSVTMDLLDNSSKTLDEIFQSISSYNVSEAIILYSVDIVNSSRQMVTFLITLVQSTNASDQTVLVETIRNNLMSALQNLKSTTVTAMIRYDGCDPEVYAGREWPETKLGSIASISCSCTEIVGSLAGRILRQCIGTYSEGSRWHSNIDNSQCAIVKSDITSTLCNLALNITGANEVYVSDRVAAITSEPENLTAADVSASASILTNLTGGATTNPDLRESFLQIIDNIQKVGSDTILLSQMEMNSSSKILDSLENFQDRVIFSENNTVEKGLFTFETFALQLQNVHTETFQGQTFIIDLGTIENNTITKLSGTRIPNSSLILHDMTVDPWKNATASVQLPMNLFDSFTTCNGTNISESVSTRLSYSVFLSNVLFQPTGTNKSRLGSIIVSARANCKSTAILNTSILTTFTANRSIANIASSSTCGSWNRQFGAWSTTDCKTVVIDTESNTRSCKCSQLAHFGLLFDLNPEPVTEDVAVVLFVITYIGLIMSLLWLTLFIVTYLCEKKLRTSIHGQVLINMSLALIGLYILFLISGHVTSIPVLCGISSVFLHYFTLSFFGWTTVEAVWLFLMLVKIYRANTFTSKFIVKSGLATWLLSLLIVIISVAAGSKYYINPFYCRATEWPFWFGMLLPFSLIYIFNWTMFIMIMVSICKHTKSTISSTSKLESTKKHFTIAITLAVVFGLGWAFGLAATSLPVKELTFTFQILFSLFVGLQGFLIFLLHGIRNKDARDLWKKWFGVAGTVGKSLYSITTSATKTSSDQVSHDATSHAMTLTCKAEASSVERICDSEEQVYNDVYEESKSTPQEVKELEKQL